MLRHISPTDIGTAAGQNPCSANCGESDERDQQETRAQDSSSIDRPMVVGGAAGRLHESPHHDCGSVLILERGLRAARGGRSSRWHHALPGVILGRLTAALRPLSERALARLAGPRAVWIASWALVPWLNAGANLLLGSERTSAIWEQSTLLIVLNYAALSFASGFTLWGAGHLARRVNALRSAVELPRDDPEPFRGMNSVIGPLVVSATAAIVFAVSTYAQDGVAPALIRGATWFLIGVPMWSYVWVYASLLLGLNRLGRERLVPDAVRIDPGLGLQPLGRIASTGLWMLLIWLVPVLLTGLPDVAGVVIGMVVLAGALGTFFLSLFGLHRQMVETKASELEIARDLYAQAYAPVRAEPTLAALERQRTLLGAADALEKRASAIHEWPIDEGTSARVITITTSVIAMTIGRLILDPLGL